MAGFTVTGLDQITTLRAKIGRAVTGVPREVQKVNRRYVSIVLATLVKHSSGRPGPNVITGAYNAAYVVQTTSDGMGVEAGNPSPQSDRLEYGFVGVDAEGRHYAQPPYPHFRPTLDEVAPKYTEDIAEAFPRWWGEN